MDKFSRVLEQTKRFMPLLVCAVIGVAFLCVALVVGPASAAAQPQVSSEVLFVKPLPNLPQGVVCDIYLTNGVIVDGNGGTPYAGGVAILGDKIVDVGACQPAPGAQIIDVGGRYITPGFIDIHTHTDDYWPNKGDGLMVLNQGVTTQIVGNCGTSVSNVAEYLDSVEGAAINVGTFYGYKALRRSFLSDAAAMTDAALAQMETQLAAAIDNGALGLSVGLSYYPQTKASYEELLALAKVVAEKDALFANHIRDEYSGVVASVEEMINLTRDSGVRMQYNHIKVAGRANWDLQDQVLQLFNAAIAEGLDIRGDAYVYEFSSWDVSGTGISVSMDNIKKVLQNPYVMVGSDSGLSASGRAVHPRAYANAVAVLIRMVRDESVLRLEEAVQKMTSMPADRLGIETRGRLAKGMQADIAVFHLEDLAENATRSNPNQMASGMYYVFVNGKAAIAAGEGTGSLNGQAIRHQ